MKLPNEIPYTFQTTYVTKTTQYIQDKYCNAIVFTNEDAAGQTTVVVNGKFLLPPPAAPAVGSGESLAIGGNKEEFFRGRVDINFNGAQQGRVSVVEKIYMIKEK